MKLGTLFLPVVSCCWAIEASAGRVEDRIARDQLAVVEESDPIMLAAIRKGRETLPDFLKLARAPPRSMSNFAVKVPIRVGDRAEYFWIADSRNENGRYSGQIDNTPRWAQGGLQTIGDPMRFALPLLILFVQTVAVANADAQSLLEKSNRGDTVTLEQGDADMAAAIDRARATVPQFLELARAPKPSMKNFAIKLPIPYAEGNEYFRLRLIEFRGDQILGQIRNTPRHAKNVKYGERILFKDKDISDWTYNDGKRMMGNFTACAMLKRETKANADAFKREFGLECDP